ncbi:MAG: PspC domain-containing protein, partial [Dehalococcoidales bacterium]|nr:PspC domain-containing protein [Dehalococcoidales bacterium]
YRSRNERVLWGVCGGLAKYFDMDPVIVRIIFVLLIFANGLGLLAYIIMAVLVPLEGSTTTAPKETIRENVQEMKQSATEMRDEIRSEFGREAKPTEQATDIKTRERRSRHILGVVLVVVGIFLLFTTLNLFSWFRWNYLWPIILIVVGLIILFARRK